MEEKIIEKFEKEQIDKNSILDDTKDYGRTQFVDEIYKLQQENQQLKIQISAREEVYRKLENNWNKLKEFLENNWKETQDVWFVKIINKMKELERGLSK